MSRDGNAFAVGAPFEGNRLRISGIAPLSSPSHARITGLLDNGAAISFTRQFTTMPAAMTESSVSGNAVVPAGALTRLAAFGRLTVNGTLTIL